LTSGLPANIHPTAPERNARPGLVGQPLLAVPASSRQAGGDSQEWLSC